MKVNFIQNFNIQQYAPAKNCNKERRCYSVSFSSADKAMQSDTVSFSKSNLLSLNEDEIISKISESVNNPYNYIGSGSEASVYRVTDEPYCVRVSNKKIPKIKKPVSQDLTVEDKINHIVAKLPDDVRVMKYLEGYPPYLVTLYKYYDISQSEVNKILEEMPVSSFQKFFRQICYAKEHDMIFDCCWSNVIINPKDKTITAIDFYKEDGSSFNNNVLKDCYSSLVYSEAPAKHKKICAAKLLLAVMQEMKPGIKPCIAVNDIDCAGFVNQFYFDESSTCLPYIKLLKKIFKDIEILKIKDLYNQDTNCLNNNVKVELNGKIKLAESLIKQIFLPQINNQIPVIDENTIYNSL